MSFSSQNFRYISWTEVERVGVYVSKVLMMMGAPHTTRECSYRYLLDFPISS